MIAVPPVAIAVSPARVVLAAGETRQLHVANRGSSPAVVGVVTAGYTLGLRGRVRILARSSSVAVTPRRLVVPARGSAALSVVGAARGPGDHPALVLLTTQRPQSDIAVRVRVGVVVLVRGAGRVVHRLAAERLRVRRGRLELWLRNRGNVAEALGIRVRLGRRVLRDTRQLLPHTRGVSELRYPGRLHGRFRVRVEIVFGGRVLRRTFRLRL